MTTSPWISLYDEETRTFREVGLTEALVRAHQLHPPQSAGGQEAPVLLRLLAAVLDAACGPATYEEWAAAWRAETLDTDRITAYLQQWEERLDLLHPEAPAFQCPGLTEYPRDARVLEPAFLGGQAAAFFNHALYAAEGDFAPAPPAQAALKLLVLLGYDVRGIKRAAPGDPAAQGGKVYGSKVGHLAQQTHVHIVGRTLKDTLLLNLPPQPRSSGDAPVWERPVPDVPMTKRAPAGRLDAWTWPSRRIRLHTDADGHVDRVAWHDGDRMTDGWQQLAAHDPMSLWRTTKKGGWSPYSVVDGHAMAVPWRVAEVVLDPEGDESGVPVHSGAARHLARVLDAGLLADYGPLWAASSTVQHTNDHQAAIAGIVHAVVPLASGTYLTSTDQRADLAASARAASTYERRVRAILRSALAPHEQAVTDRVDFMPLYDPWQTVAELLADDLLQGRAQWRRMLRDHVTGQLDALPLRAMVKAKVTVQAQNALSHTGLDAPARTAKPAERTGRPPTRSLTAFGETKSLAQWAKDPRCPVSYPTLRARAAALADGDDVERIITTPPTRGKRPAPPATSPERAEAQAAPELRCHHCRRRLAAEHTRARCEECDRKRVGQDFAYRKEIAQALFPEGKRAELLQRLTEGERLADACTALDLTPHRVHGYAAYEDTWREQLDAALMAGRDPGLDHGTETAYRHGGCRCPQCRNAHDDRRR